MLNMNVHIDIECCIFLNMNVHIDIECCILLNMNVHIDIECCILLNMKVHWKLKNSPPLKQLFYCLNPLFTCSVISETCHMYKFTLEVHFHNCLLNSALESLN